MSRGLSQQQRRILGLAYAFNVQLNGGEYRLHEGIVPAGDKYREGYRHLLIVENTTPPDLFPWMLEHYVGGVPFKTLHLWRDELRSTAFYAKTSDYKCKKASLRRALSALWDKGLLATHTWWKPGSRADWRSKITHGYVLAPPAISMAAGYRYDIGDAVETVCAMFAATLWGAGGTCTTKDHPGLHLRRYAEANGYHGVTGDSEVTDTVSVTSTQTVDEVTHTAKRCHVAPRDAVTVTPAENPATVTDTANSYPRGGARTPVTINRDGSIAGECYRLPNGGKQVTDTEAAA